MKLLFCLTALFLSIFVSPLHAQPLAKVSITPSTTSLIVKLRPELPSTDTAVIRMFRTVTTGGASRLLFPSRPGLAAVRSVDTLGLSRIVRLDLREGISSQDAVRILSDSKLFAYVEPNYTYHIDAAPIVNDSLYSEQWYLKNIHAPEAWKTTIGDTTVHIGFVDTGVDWLHPDLVGQFAVNPSEDLNHNGIFDPWPSTEKHADAYGDSVSGDLDGIDNDGNGYVDDVIGYDFIDQASVNVGDYFHRDPIPQDENGHGTYVAGVLAAKQNNRAGISGVAPGCRLVALRAFDATGNGEDDDIATAIVYAADNNVRILNLSFGDIIPSLLQRDAIRYALAHGTLVFASSGNGGGDSPHYPSDFDETVSAGGTTDYPTPDNLFSLTTHSENMDLVAPADDITTTAPGGGYRTVAGTSFSSPISAATAALLLSARPNLKPLELRSILESTTEDVGSLGYDHESANGRVDALAATSYQGGAALEIANVHSLDEYHIGDTLTIRGSAASTLFTNYSLSVADGMNPDDGNSSDAAWHVIGSSNSQTLDGILGLWDTHGYTAGEYTLRLFMRSSDQRSTEQRINIRLATYPPRFVALQIDTIYVNDGRGLLLLAQSDMPCQFETELTANGNRSIKRDDRIALEHVILVTNQDAPIGQPLSIRAILRSSDGDSAVQTATATILDQGISQQGFIEKPYALPPGYALDSVLALPAGDEVVESVFPDGLHFGPLKVFSFDGKGFHQTDSMSDTWIPRAFGDTHNDGKPELLLQASNQSMLLRLNGRGILGDTLFQNRDYSFWGSTLADLDGDGKSEIVGYIDSANRYSDSVYQAYTWNGDNSYSILGRMLNPTSTAWNNQFNSYTEPNAAHADLSGSGQQDLISLDGDADLVIYRRDPAAPTGFRAIYTESNDGEAEGSLVTTGDFDGDGKPDIAYAFHSVFSEDTLSEYPPAYWTLKILRNTGNDTFSTILTDHFYYARPLDPYRSSVRSVHSVTGRSVDDLICSFFPNLYLLEFDSSQKKMTPIWHYAGASLSPRGAIAYDFDRNGKREFGFVVEDSIHFFEHEDDYADQTPTPGAFQVAPLAADRVSLSWGEVPGATSYYILRADDGATAFDSVDATSATSYMDSTVTDGDLLDYSVVAYDAGHKIPISLPAFVRQAFVHETPVLLSAISEGRNVQIRTSEPIMTAAISAGALIVDDSLLPTSISVGGDSVVVLGFAHSLVAGTHHARVSSTELRDRFNSPFDTAQVVTWQAPADSIAERFYLVRWAFETEDGVTKAHLFFNQSASDDALDVSRYTLSPYGLLVSVSRDNLDSLALYITLGSGTNFQAIGVPFVLCVSGITSKSRIALDDREANCAGVSLTEPDLTHTYVYPDPATSNDESVTFARLTAHAEIRIYTLGMKYLRTIETTAEQGGATWDLRDDRGLRVPSGEYLYFVTGTDDSGTTVEGHAGKFVIVRNGQ